ncbi:MAG: AraC family transcriptional regulator [Bacteroidota bacterium]
MLIDHRTVSFQGKPLFQRARFKTPFQISGKMEDMACFFYMVEGSYEIFDMHGAVKMGPNEALLKKCGSYVSHLAEGKWDGVVIFFYPDILHEIYKHQPPAFLEQTKALPPKKMVGNELVEKFIHSLMIYFDNPELMDEELALLKIKELILILLKSSQYQHVRQFMAHLFTPEKLYFTSVIEKNLFSNLSLEELAFICNKSLSSFKREFKRIYQQSPARYIKQRRLEQAARLLRTSGEAIAGIAYSVGFQDVTTFSASFREHFGDSPSAYRLAQTRK